MGREVRLGLRQFGLGGRRAGHAGCKRELGLREAAGPAEREGGEMGCVNGKERSGVGWLWGLSPR